MPYCLFFCFLSATVLVKAQEKRVVLYGNIKAEVNEIQDVTIQNITSLRGAISDVSGYFSIPVQINDTLLFSALQFKKKTIVIDASILKSKSITVVMQEVDNKLDEVVVMPYNLTGNLTKDANLLKKEVVTASTLGLPNAYVVKMTQSERMLIEADRGKMVTILPLYIGVNTHKLLNKLSGRTKMLKESVARDEKNEVIAQLKRFFPDSVIASKLKIPAIRVNEFIYYSEVDTNFRTIMETNEVLKIWEFLKIKSVAFRKENELE